jgi:hypothetical protein
MKLGDTPKCLFRDEQKIVQIKEVLSGEWETSGQPAARSTHTGCYAHLPRAQVPWKTCTEQSLPAYQMRLQSRM